MKGQKAAPGPAASPGPVCVLLVEDDLNLGEVIRDLLEIKGYRVVLTRDGESSLTTFLKGAFHLCLIDVMLPRMDGFALARAIRKSDREVPIIFLTAKAMKEDRVEGFKAGGDDYVTKPFHTEELLLRIEAVLRRSRGEASAGGDDAVLSIGAFRFDPGSRTLELRGSKRSLTQKESDLLELFARHRNEVLERDTAMRVIWGAEGYFVSRSMDVYISKLRKLLSADPRVEIQNIHGRGFKLLVR